MIENRKRGNLLDTHIALWALGKPDRLSDPSREAILSGPNLLSVVSYWEVAIKSMKGKLDVGDPRAWWAAALDKLVATPIVLRPDHVAALATLPPIHRDPFDRMLIAQSLSEDLRLVSADPEIAKYASAGLHVVI